MGVQSVDRSWTVEEMVPLLQVLSFFRGLPREDLEFAAGLLTRVAVKDGECLFRQGEPGEAFYVVQEGGVELNLERPSGGVEKLAHRRPGEILGEAALLHGGPHSSTATAVGDTLLLHVHKDAFQDLLTNNGVAQRILGSLARAQRVLDLRLSAQERLGQKSRDDARDLKELSRVIQRGILPREAPKVAGYDIAVSTSMGEGSSGRTIWDHFELKNGELGLVSFNVLGEGLPPAYYVAVARSLLRELARDHAELRGVLPRLNSGLAGAVVEGMGQFVEAGMLIPSRSGVEWAGAGRCPGGVIRRTGVFQELTSQGPPLGMLAGFLYGTQRMELGAGDSVLVLSEASQGIFRGAADLVATLHGKPVGEVVSTLRKALSKARQDEDPDVSVLFVRKQ
jgi:CRP-like cAMP-binding protein